MLKKSVYLGIVFLMLFLLAGCESQKEDETMGTFYSLHEAYEEGLLTMEDLQSIAYYFHGKSDDENFVPIPKNPVVLNVKMEKNIKQTYRVNLLGMPEASFDRISIWKYYGTYNDCIAVGITDNYNAYDLLIVPEYTVGGIKFYNFALSDIRLWCE